MLGIPLPDLSDDSETPPPVSIPRTIKESTSHGALFTLSKCCDPSTTFNSKTINGLEYDSDHPIYRSRTCTLYIARKNGIYYALKTGRSNKILMHENNVYSELGAFPTIIKCHGFIKERAQVVLQLEYAFGGSIANTVLMMHEFEAWRILAHVSAALHHLHSKGFIHLDISPANILQCNGNGCYIYKLADFGTVLENGKFDSFCEGAGPYAAPEALYFPNTPYAVSQKADIWSFGALMYEVVTHHKVPRDSDGYDAIRNGTFDLSLVPQEFQIIKQMLKVDPDQRPAAADLVQLPKVKDILDRLSYETVQVIRLESPKFESRRRQSFDCI